MPRKKRKLKLSEYKLLKSEILYRKKSIYILHQLIIKKINCTKNIYISFLQLTMRFIFIIAGFIFKDYPFNIHVARSLQHNARGTCSRFY